MAAIWKPKDNEVLKHWVDTIQTEASDKLTEWELEFIESIEARVALGKVLSQKQEEILEKIYAEKTS